MDLALTPSYMVPYTWIFEGFGFFKWLSVQFILRKQLQIDKQGYHNLTFIQLEQDIDQLPIECFVTQ